MTKQITFADEFYSLPPSERTKANLQKLFEKYQEADEEEEGSEFFIPN